MLIPLRTDAPIYHFPTATILLIVTNIACYVLTNRGGEQALMPWILEYGHINPLEWVSSLFAHSGLSHLVFNMFFLWSFGLIVEGKLGFRGMLVIYLSIGIGQCAIEQVLMLWAADGGSLGASSAVMGLMALCLVWAPMNEFTTFIIIFIRAFVFDITIYWYCILYLIEELINFLLLDQGQIGTSALHLMGAAVGFAVGTVYLRKGWVDCENWDLYRVISGNYGPYANKETTVGAHADPELMFGKKNVAYQDDQPNKQRRPKRRERLRAIEQAIDSGDCMRASELLFDLRLSQPDAALSSGHMKKLAIGLIQANMPDDAALYLEEVLAADDSPASDWARLRLAQITLQIQKRPAAALTLIKEIKRASLTDAQISLAKKVAAKAKRQIDNGIEDAQMEW